VRAVVHHHHLHLRHSVRASGAASGVRSQTGSLYGV
jgi:hypothetical protein